LKHLNVLQAKNFSIRGFNHSWNIVLISATQSFNKTKKVIKKDQQKPNRGLAIPANLTLIRMTKTSVPVIQLSSLLI
jgi:hypothetical protein